MVDSDRNWGRKAPPVDNTEKAAKRAKPGQAKNRAPDQSNRTTQNELARALEHHAAGRLPQAESIYQQILQTDPRQPVAWHLLGVIAHQEGKNDVAVDLITKSLAIKPDFAEAHSNLGKVLKDLGKFDEAVASYRRALAIKPDYASAHSNLGNALRGLGKLDEAVDSYHKALAIKPDFAEAHSNLGNSLRVLGKFEEAVASYHKALTIKPDIAEAHSDLGNALKDLGRPAEGVASFRRALALRPDSAETHCNLGTAFAELGKLDAAITSCRQAFALKPDFAEVHLHLASMKKHTEHDDDIRAMEHAYAKSAFGDGQRMHLAFGLGKAYEDLRRYDTAFGFFAEGNRNLRNSRSFSIDDHGHFFERLKEVFDSALFTKHRGTGCRDEAPIFVLGMLRSGTTLVEQILASHPRVHGAGELESLSRVIASHVGTQNAADIPAWIGRADGAEFESAGVEYIQAVRTRAS
ncbi:MAG: Beta-barrel assembly-enhancing protease [Alphaproteobacteria bacterium MarineAlpha10_Bin2]|nr:MAG: Beta-barrel assembly-enhancing protease [Alphaproteobacteria bacterium MarineAlpha10_Bin2]